MMLRWHSTTSSSLLGILHTGFALGLWGNRRALYWGARTEPPVLEGCGCGTAGLCGLEPC